MAAKILVAYATRYGSTEEIAGRIAETLKKDGYDSECKNILDITSVEGYDAVIAGSAIQMGKWLPEGRDFMQLHRDYLNRVPLFVFSSGITLCSDDEHTIRKALFATDEIKQFVSPEKIGLFAGKLDNEMLCDSDRQIITLAKPKCGDFRDFDAIVKWVRDIESEYLSSL